MDKESWVDITKKAFVFASNAGKAFSGGSPEVKKSILIGIGLNWTLLDHKLTIQAQNWLIPFMNQETLGNTQKEALEPAAVGVFTNKTDSEESALSICTIRRSQWSNIRTWFINEFPNVELINL